MIEYTSGNDREDNLPASEKVECLGCVLTACMSIGELLKNLQEIREDGFLISKDTNGAVHITTDKGNTLSFRDANTTAVSINFMNTGDRSYKVGEDPNNPDIPDCIRDVSEVLTESVEVISRYITTPKQQKPQTTVPAAIEISALFNLSHVEGGDLADLTADESED